MKRHWWLRRFLHEVHALAALVWIEASQWRHYWRYKLPSAQRVAQWASLPAGLLIGEGLAQWLGNDRPWFALLIIPGALLTVPLILEARQTFRKRKP